MRNREMLFFDQKSSKIIIDLCFLINGLSHQLASPKIVEFRKLLECDSLIQKRLDYLISSQTNKEYACHLEEGKTCLKRILDICNTTTDQHLLDQEKLKTDLIKIESLLNKLST